MGEPGHLGTEERRLSAASDDDDPLLRDRSDHRMAGIPPGEPAGLEDDAVDGGEGAEALRAVAVQAWGTRSAEGDSGHGGSLQQQTPLGWKHQRSRTPKS